jgi:hypothetical protein
MNIMSEEKQSSNLASLLFAEVREIVLLFLLLLLFVVLELYTLLERSFGSLLI